MRDREQMKIIKLIKITIIMSFVFVSVADCQENAKVTEEFKRVSFYVGAQQTKYYMYNDGSTEGVSYHVRLPYATKEVLEFYDKKLGKEGYKPYVEEYYAYADRKWRTFIDGTEKSEPYVAQLRASWIDQTGKKRANLNLRYYWYVDSSKSEVILGANDDMNVDFQIMPFMKLPPSQRQPEQQQVK